MLSLEDGIAGMAAWLIDDPPETFDLLDADVVEEKLTNTGFG
jgi:hypothetical protein